MAREKKIERKEEMFAVVNIDMLLDMNRGAHYKNRYVVLSLPHVHRKREREEVNLTILPLCSAQFATLSIA